MKPSSDHATDLGSLTPDAALALVEVLAEDMIERWRQGEHILPEAYLDRFPGLREHPEAAADLIYEEVNLRPNTASMCRQSVSSSDSRSGGLSSKYSSIAIASCRTDRPHDFPGPVRSSTTSACSPGSAAGGWAASFWRARCRWPTALSF